jgi:3-dehydroquinate dehydratase-2
VPTVEVHISDVDSREEWRSVSVFDGLVLEKISGEGEGGYRRALELLKRELDV